MSDQQQIISLPEDCGTHWVCAAHELFTRQLAGGDLRLIASEVRRIGTPAVQLMLALARALAAQETALRVEAPSPAFVAAFADLGLGADLARWCEGAAPEVAHG